MAWQLARGERYLILRDLGGVVQLLGTNYYWIIGFWEFRFITWGVFATKDEHTCRHGVNAPSEKVMTSLNTLPCQAVCEVCLSTVGTAWGATDDVLPGDADLPLEQVL